MVQVHHDQSSPPGARIMPTDSLPKFHITTVPVTDESEKSLVDCSAASTSSSLSHADSPENVLGIDSDSAASRSSRNSMIRELYVSGNELSPVSVSGSDRSHVESSATSSMSLPEMRIKNSDELGYVLEGSTTNSTTPSPTSRKSSIQIGASGLPIDKRHICEICGKGFPYLSILESHKRCHTGEKPFACHFCDKKFAQKATLQVHERTHTGERPYKCKYCEKTFAQYGTKTVHEKSAHLGIRNYKCPKCSKCLSSPSALYTHKKTHGEKTFHCEFCPKTFTLKNYLKLHVKQVHEQNERKHICQFCSKSFAYAGSLQVHVRTHTGERPYICKFCPKAFASQGNLQSHERTHTGERPYSCQHCGRAFIQKSQLTAHEATHNYAIGRVSPSSAAGDSPRKQNDYVCKFCGKRYAYASSLYVHTRLHTGERPFRCNFCDKSFTNQGNMQVHQRVHTGEKPYKCEACGKSYAQKVGLKIHQEQCQIYLNRRGSVMTVGTTESESSPSADENADDVGHMDIVVDDDDEPKLERYAIMTGPLKPRPVVPSNASSVFSSPIHSQRGSFSSEMVFTSQSPGMLDHHHPQQHFLNAMKLPTLAMPSSISNNPSAYPLSPILTNSVHSGTSSALQSPVVNGCGAANGVPNTRMMSAFHEVFSAANGTQQATGSGGILGVEKNANSLAHQMPSSLDNPSTALTSLLLEQLDPHQNAQLTALRALLDLATAPQPTQLPPATPNVLVPQLSQFINSQLQQQLLNQLLLQSYGTPNVPSGPPSMNGSIGHLGNAVVSLHSSPMPSSSAFTYPSSVANGCPPSSLNATATAFPSAAAIVAAALRDIAKPEIA